MKSNLKIRHYVIGQLYQSGGRQRKLPSARELASRFGLAMSTVSLALGELVEEGYLIPRKGVGFFINPARLSWPLEGTMPLLVGIVAGDGKNYYHDSFYWQEYAPLVSCLIARGWNIRPVSLESHQEPEIVEELANIEVDALVWLRCPLSSDGALQLAAGKTPVVFIANQDYAGARVLRHDWEALTAEYARLAAAGTDCRRIAFFMEDSEWMEPEAHLAAAFEQQGKSPEIVRINPADRDMEEALRRTFQTGTDLLFTSIMCSHMAMRLLKETGSAAEVRRFGSIGDGDRQFSLIFDPEFQARETGRMLAAAFGGDHSPQSVRVPFCRVALPKFITSRFQTSQS